MLEGQFIKSLGNLDEGSKKIIWHTCISGSQIKRLFYNMKEVYTEKTSVAIDKVFSDRANAKMEVGRAIEPFIREMAKKKWNLDIEYSPETYALKANPMFTANIDGFIRTPNGLQIIEIKNTEETDIDKVYEYYKYQIQYYLWFFNAVSARLIILSNGWDLQQKEIARDEELQVEIVNRANALAKAINTGELDEKYFNPAIEEVNEKGVTIKYLEDEMEEKLNRLYDLKADVLIKENDIKALEQEIKDLYASEAEKVILATDRCSYSLTTSERKGTINYKQYFADKEIPMEELEDYRGETTTLVRGVFTKM